MPVTQVDHFKNNKEKQKGRSYVPATRPLSRCSITLKSGVGLSHSERAKTQVGHTKNNKEKSRTFYDRAVPRNTRAQATESGPQKAKITRNRNPRPKTPVHRPGGPPWLAVPLYPPFRQCPGVYNQNPFPLGSGVIDAVGCPPRAPIKNRDHNRSPIDHPPVPDFHLLR